MREQDQAAHRWYRFVLSYPPHLVQDYLHKFGIGEDQQVPASKQWRETCIAHGLDLDRRALLK